MHKSAGTKVLKDGKRAAYCSCGKRYVESGKRSHLQKRNAHLRAVGAR